MSKSDGRNPAAVTRGRHQRRELIGFSDFDNKTGDAGRERPLIHLERAVTRSARRISSVQYRTYQPGASCESSVAAPRGARARPNNKWRDPRRARMQFPQVGRSRCPWTSCYRVSMRARRPRHERLYRPARQAARRRCCYEALRGSISCWSAPDRPSRTRMRPARFRTACSLRSWSVPPIGRAAVVFYGPSFPSLEGAGVPHTYRLLRRLALPAWSGDQKAVDGYTSRQNNTAIHDSDADARSRSRHSAAVSFELRRVRTDRQQAGQACRTCSETTL